jgi:hypothetical protein
MWPGRARPAEEGWPRAHTNTQGANEDMNANGERRSIMSAQSPT